MADIEAQFAAITVPDAWIEYTYNTPDDLKSVRLWIANWLSPRTKTGKRADTDNGEPNLYIVPDLTTGTTEGKFERPAITIALLSDVPGPRRPANGSNYSVQHLLSLVAYGRDRPETVTLAARLYSMFEEGDGRQAVNRIPMWATDFNARLARMMRVLPESLSMSMAEPNDDEGKWQQSLEVRVEAPRLRPVPATPIVRRVAINGA